MIPVLHGVWAAAGGAVGDFEHIETQTLSGNATSVTFSSIAGTYKHLQLRCLSRTDRATYSHDNMRIQFNSDTGTNYRGHYLRGNGTAASSVATVAETSLYIMAGVGTTVVTNVWGAMVLDILDYTSTSKNKTVRYLNGIESNGGAGGAPDYVVLGSGLWFATPAAITTIKLMPESGTNFVVNSTFSLYGVK